MRFELQPGESAGTGLRRVARGLMDETLAQLDDPAQPRETTVHEARKSMKKLRGLLRLVRPAVPELYRTENAALRDAAAELSALRDADVALETFDRVIATAPAAAEPRASTGAAHGGLDAESAANLPGEPEPAALDTVAWAPLRARLAAWRAEAQAADGQPEARIRAFREQLLAARERAADWCLPPADEEASAFAVFGRGLKKTYKRGRKAMTRAYAQPGVAAFHDWRKRTKYLGYHLRLLRPAWPDLLRAQRTAVKALSDRLGDDHDLAVLDELLVELRDDEAPVAQRHAEAGLRAELRRQSAMLRGQAEGLGHYVYAERPKAFRRRIGVYWRQAEAGAQSEERP
ncbi:CHAD domain-containing protein [Thiohalocapsa halophila]